MSVRGLPLPGDHITYFEHAFGALGKYILWGVSYLTFKVPTYLGQRDRINDVYKLPEVTRWFRNEIHAIMVVNGPLPRFT